MMFTRSTSRPFETPGLTFSWMIGRCWITVLLLVGHSTSLAQIAVEARSFISPSRGASAGTQAADAKAIRPRLELTSGDYAAGTPIDHSDPSALRWQSPHFAAPIDFRLSHVARVRFPAPPDRPRATGQFCFELSGDDVLAGDLLELSDESITIHSSAIGRMQLPRARVRRIMQWQDGASLLYYGPRDLDEWKKGPGCQFTESGAGLTSNHAGDLVYGDVSLPQKAIVEFDLSWKVLPDFVLALGVNDQPDSAATAFRFEVWEKQVVAVYESKDDADVASIRTIAPGPGRLRLVACIDQSQGTMDVLTPSGDRLAHIEATPVGERVSPGVSLMNLEGDLTLNRLLVRAWNGTLPATREESAVSVQQVDGESVRASRLTYDAEVRSFLAQSDGMSQRIAQDRIDVIYLPGDVDSEARPLTVNLTDNSRLSGRYRGIASGRLQLEYPGAGMIEIPLELVSGLTFASKDGAISSGPREGRVGRLVLSDTQLEGMLVPGDEAAEGSCLVWQSLAAKNAGPLRHGVSGRIIYRDPQVRRRTSRQAQSEPSTVFGGLFRRLFGSGNTSSSDLSADRFILLRSGDLLPATVTRIDERGVTFTSPVTDATFIPDDSIHIVQLAPPLKPTLLEGAKRQRLLTLPRLQRDDPPTHLICSRNGDYLRGRLMELNDQLLTMEVRLNVKSLPRDRIHQIVWLPPPDEKPPADTTTAETQGTRVQIRRSDGIRMTFWARQFDGNVLSGISPLLGSCHADLLLVDDILLGAEIDRAAAGQWRDQWQLRHAPEPLAASDNGEGTNPGSESVLVGKPAFNFELDQLGGGTLKLSSLRGKVVVLDFWATWCGPCLQTMPQVERVMSELSSEDVQLLAVNLQESPEKIQSTLERLKLDVRVVLDRDGAVAAKYGVTAIPQTVIVDRQGNIARLFIGGGANFGDQLRDALREVLETK